MNFKFIKLITFTVIALCVLSMIFTGCYADDENLYSSYKQIFEGDKIIDINVEIDEYDWSDMLENALDEKYKSANITVDGYTVENIGFRTKGNLTLRSVSNTDSDRFSFRVKFDKYTEGQNLLGLDELVLNNMYSDASYMREYLTYEALDKIGANTPEAVFANLYVNGELKGLYLAVEAIDDTFIADNFGSSNGNLYKAEQGSSLKYDENSSYDSLELKIGNDTDKNGLKNFIKILNSTDSANVSELEKVFDVDSALQYIAMNYSLSNYDSYQGNLQQNYYLYEDENGIFHLIPWDFNMSFGGFGGGSASDINSPVDRGDLSNYPLVEKLLGIDEYKQKYYQYVKQMLEYLNIAEDRVYELKSLIADSVDKDATKFYTTEQFDSATTFSETDEGSEIAEQDRFSQMPGDDSGNLLEFSGRKEGGTDNMKPPEMPEMDSDKDEFKDRNNKRGGGMMHGNGKSIINVIRERIQDISTQMQDI